MKEWFNQILHSGNQEKVLFQWKAQPDGVMFNIDTKLWTACQAGTAPPVTIAQYGLLQMLTEEGLAERLDGCFIVKKDAIISLEDDLSNALGLPPPISQSFEAQTEGRTNTSGFRIRLAAHDGPNLSTDFREKGGLFLFKGRYWRMTLELSTAFDAIEHHNQSTGTEVENLSLIASLKGAIDAGARIDLRHFNNIQVSETDKPGVALMEDSHGIWQLVPALPSITRDTDRVNALAQLQKLKEKPEGALRINNQLIAVNDQAMEGIREILEAPKMSKEQIQRFIESPSAFLDAGLVNLDTGFSIRVTGAEVFTHINFGETDASGINWFDNIERQALPFTPDSTKSVIGCPDDFLLLKQSVDDAVQQGASQVAIGEKVFDISDPAIVKATLDKLQTDHENGALYVRPDPSTGPGNDEEPEDQIVITTDDDGEHPEAEVIDFFRRHPLRLTGLARQPFEHQKIGMQWLCHFSSPARQDGNTPRIPGALLADDMGLGKTFITLASINELYQANEQKPLKPVLIVAPLGLLQNWSVEIDQTFETSPFKSIVILQANESLKKFRIEGVGRETHQTLDGLSGKDALDKIRYALKVGPDFQQERLDLPGRVVITTYDTLANYQFSLARVDWAMAIFDEAQNIKNPNTLVSRAAKAIKADFKLAVTGTPVENSLQEIWNLLNTVYPDHLGNWDHFRTTYISPINKAPRELKSQTQIDIGRKLRARIGDVMLRRTKEEQLPDLPRKHLYGWNPGGDNILLNKPELGPVMQDNQLDAYNRVHQDYALKVAMGQGQGQTLAALQLLNSTSLHASIGYEVPIRNKKEALQWLKASGKTDAALKILYSIREKKEKVIIFAINKAFQHNLKTALNILFTLDIAIINGDTKTTSRYHNETRQGLIRAFEEKPGFNIIVMSPVAAGVGLTVTAANHVIHIERHWNPAKEAQATDRVYRIGQKKDVHIYFPCLRHPDSLSFDENISRLLDRKVDLSGAVVTPNNIKPEDFLDAFDVDPDHQSPSGFEAFWCLTGSNAERQFLRAFIKQTDARPAGDHILANDMCLELQKQRGKYRFDFFIDDRFVIEIDGKHHQQAYTRHKDSQRDEWCEAEGLLVMRIEAKDVFRNPVEAVQKVLDFVVQH